VYIPLFYTLGAPWWVYTLVITLGGTLVGIPWLYASLVPRWVYPPVYMPPNHPFVGENSGVYASLRLPVWYTSLCDTPMCTFNRKEEKEAPESLRRRERNDAHSPLLPPCVCLMLLMCPGRAQGGASRHLSVIIPVSLLVDSPGMPALSTLMSERSAPGPRAGFYPHPFHCWRYFRTSPILNIPTLIGTSLGYTLGS